MFCWRLGTPSPSSSMSVDNTLITDSYTDDIVKIPVQNVEITFDFAVIHQFTVNHSSLYA